MSENNYIDEIRPVWVRVSGTWATTYVDAIRTLNELGTFSTPLPVATE